MKFWWNFTINQYQQIFLPPSALPNGESNRVESTVRHTFMYICDYKIRRETKLSHDKSEVRTQSEKQVQFGTRSHRKTQSRAQFEKDGLTKKLILLFTQEVHRYETFRISSLHTENTGTTHLGFLCFTQQVHRYDAFRVSSLHTGSTQVQSL